MQENYYQTLHKVTVTGKEKLKNVRWKDISQVKGEKIGIPCKTGESRWRQIIILKTNLYILDN